MIETRSPGSIPNATRPLATVVTLSAKVWMLIGVQVPPRPALSSRKVPAGARATRSARSRGMDTTDSGVIRLGLVISRTASPVTSEGGRGADRPGDDIAG